MVIILILFQIMEKMPSFIKLASSESSSEEKDIKNSINNKDEHSSDEDYSNNDKDYKIKKNNIHIKNNINNNENKNKYKSKEKKS